jgi:uncharacterized protein (TIGR00251 family)
VGDEPAGWLRPAPDGAIVRVHVVPRAARSGLAGFHGEALRVRVAAPPREGAANRELLRALAAALGIREGDLGLESGARGREKRVRVRGLGPDEVRARLAPAFSVDRAGERN